MQIEIEKKSLISQKEYFQILKNNLIISEISQINFYFETKDNYYKNNNSALRVRLKNNNYQLTLKVSLNQVNEEYNFTITKDDFKKMLMGQVNSKISDITNNYDTLSNVATIRTIRSKIDYQNHVVEVDFSVFNKAFDFEIEVESYSLIKAEITLINFLKDNNAVFQKSKPKIARFFEYNS